MHKLRSYVLPTAILLGLIFHRWCGMLSFLSPYLIFAILFLNFVAVDVRKLRFTRLSMWLLLFQAVVSIACYYLISSIFHNELVAQGVLIGVLCPVASSVVVISCLLGANRETVTEYTILCNLMVSVVAPFYFTFIGVHQDLTFWSSFLLILRKIGPTIALPFFVALLLQLVWKKGNAYLARFTNITFYLWAFLLFLTLGQTIDYIFIHGQGNGINILWLGIASVLACTVHFAVGKWIGRKYGDTMAGGQMLGQKNTAMAIWMANTYLNPLASVFLAFYSVWQNLFNSWQIWRHDKRQAEA
jgi:BASS family bile acid:Na+ symporter